MILVANKVVIVFLNKMLNLTLTKSKVDDLIEQVAAFQLVQNDKFTLPNLIARGQTQNSVLKILILFK
jgi:hypothetical protein